MNVVKKLIALAALISFAGCTAARSIHTPKSESNWQNDPQVEAGQPFFLADALGNIIGLPSKVLLLNSKIDNHHITPETKQTIQEYIEDNPATMSDTKVRLNQFAPVGEFKRLVKNKKMQWWWRVFPGIPVTVFSLGGRLLGGDHYNPYTDTINIYSDVPAVALHEAGHAADFAQYSKEGTAGFYAVGRILIPVTLYQEYVASEEAINYLKETKNSEGEQEAYKTLYPAYGTYVGAATGIPYANAMGAAAGHIVSFTPRKNNRLAYEAFAEAKWSTEVVTDLRSDPLAKDLLDDWEKVPSKR